VKVEIPSIHATCVLAGARAVLIRGPSGSGKSRLALQILQAADQGALRFARLVSDDRTCLESVNGRLLARPAPALSGLLELRHIGIRQMQIEPVAVVGLVVETMEGAPRLPEQADRTVELAGNRLPRLAVASFHDALPLVLAELSQLENERVLK
jgi:HPr kinase/phosphorylase